MNGVYNYQFKDPKLVIQDSEKVAAGTYSGNIVWNLSDVPFNKRKYSFVIHRSLSPQIFNSWEEAEEARHQQVMSLFSEDAFWKMQQSNLLNSYVTTSDHKSLAFPEEIYKYKFKYTQKSCLQYNLSGKPTYQSIEHISPKKFITYREAQNHLDEYCKAYTYHYEKIIDHQNYMYVSLTTTGKVTDLSGNVVTQ